jgi:hypothetical protein
VLSLVIGSLRIVSVLEGGEPVKIENIEHPIEPDSAVIKGS